MATLQELRTRINRKLKDPNNTARSPEVITEEINRAIRYYQNRPFTFNEGLITLTAQSGTQRLTGLPSDLNMELQDGGLILIDNQVRIDLIKLPPANFAERDDDQTGRPYYYTYRDQSYDLLPTPQQDYPVQFRYLIRYEDLVNDSDTNAFTENAEDLLVAHVLARLTAEDKQDTQLGTYYEQLRLDELKALRDRTDARLSSGFVRSESILDNYYFW